MSKFESRWGQEFSLLHIVQTGFEVHPTSCPIAQHAGRDREGYRGGHDAAEKKKNFLSLPVIESKLLGRPARKGKIVLVFN
jgi:hypothetical protein